MHRHHAARDRLRRAGLRAARRARGQRPRRRASRSRYLPANLHNRPERIVPALAAAARRARPRGAAGVHRLRRLRHRRCSSTRGSPTIGRASPACRARTATSSSPGRRLFAALHDAEPGTFYLTDFLAKHFDALVWQGLGLDRHPQLRDTYFGNYTRLVLLSQTDRPGDRRGRPAPRPTTRARLRAPPRRTASRSPKRVGVVVVTGRVALMPRGVARAEMVVIYWRDIPAQVNGQAGAMRHRCMLPHRFQRADRPGQAQGRHLHGRRGRRASGVASSQPCDGDLASSAPTALADQHRDRVHPRAARHCSHYGGWDRPTSLRASTPTSSPPSKSSKKTTDTSADRPDEQEESNVTHTVVSSATREVVIGFDRPFVMIGERINPTGRKLLAEEMKAGDFSRVEADALAQVAAGAHMLDVNAGIPLADEPALLARAITARAGDHRRAAVDRLVDRRGARGRAGGVPGQAARQLGHRRGRGDGAGAAAGRQVRRRGGRDLERRDRHLDGSRRALRGRPARSSTAPPTTASRPATSSSTRWSCRSARWAAPASRRSS